MKDKIYFQGENYYTFNYYNKKIRNLEGDLSITPAYIMLSIFITILICWAIHKNFTKKAYEPYKDETEMSEKAQKYNHFVLFKKLKNTFSLKKKINPNPETVPKTVNEPNSFGTKLEKYQTETNTKFNQLSEKIDTSMIDLQAEIHKDIDRILKANGTPVTSDSGGKKK